MVIVLHAKRIINERNTTTRRAHTHTHTHTHSRLSTYASRYLCLHNMIVSTLSTMVVGVTENVWIGRYEWSQQTLVWIIKMMNSSNGSFQCNGDVSTPHCRVVVRALNCFCNYCLSLKCSCVLPTSAIDDYSTGETVTTIILLLRLCFLYNGNPNVIIRCAVWF